MHLDTSAALAHVEGRLDKDQEVYWNRHMEVCDRCAKVVLQWKQLTADLRRAHLVSASEQDLNNAVRVFAPAEKQEGETWRSIVAAIVFDSFRQPAMAGVRGVSGMAPRQIVMRAAEFDIHIKVWGDNEHRQMLGQLLPRNRPDFVRSARFHLLHNGEKFGSTTPDETGEFQFTAVPDGDVSLQIDLPDLTVIGSLKTPETP